MSPNRPIARRGYLVTFEVEELIGRNILRQDIPVTVSLQHRREHDTMEHDIILADKMHKFRIL